MVLQQIPKNLWDAVNSQTKVEWKLSLSANSCSGAIAPADHAAGEQAAIPLQ